MPDLDQIIAGWWGCAYQSAGLTDLVSSAANIAFGTNPAFTATDFLTVYPKFGGVPVTVTGTLTTGSPTVTAVSAMTGLAVGQLIAGTGIPGGTTITAIASNTLTLSVNSTASGAQAVTVWTAMLIPLVVLNLYISLASASLASSRWQDGWLTGMAFYVAHFATLWLQSEGNPVSTAGAAAISGLAHGIVVSKSVGDVSMAMQAPQGYDSWGAFALTTYGQQFVSLARIMGWGPMYIW